jgi:type III pantothenate kinase
MLLVIDVGNTNTVLGVFEQAAHRPGEDVTVDSARYERLVANWRVGSHLARTVDEYGVIFRNLFSMDNLEVSGVHGIVISSVVPPLDPVLRQVCERYFNIKPLFIEPGVKTGMQVLYDNPAEVGADRIVNAVAAFEKYGGPCVIVDFGTATTFDCISKKGEYMGAPATGRDSQAGASDWHDDGRQFAVWTLLRLFRAGRWHPGATGRRHGFRDARSCNGRFGGADWYRVAFYKRCQRASDP